MKKLFVIPAYGDTAREKRYAGILSEARKKKYSPVILNLQIKQGKVLSELVTKAINTIGKEEHASVFGFSMGALIGYCVSTRLPLRKVVLSSISSYLNGDIRKLGPRFKKHLGKRLTRDIQHMQYKPVIAKKVSILYGENEHPVLVARSKSIFKKARTKNKKLIVIKNTGHGMSLKYIRAIKKEL